MTTQQSTTPFAERLKQAVGRETDAGRGHARRTRAHAPFATVANPARVRSHDDLMAERIRNAMD